VNASAYKIFELTGTTPKVSRGVPKFEVNGRDAAEFVVDEGRAGSPGSVNSPAPGGTPSNPAALVLQSTCLGGAWNQTGSCGYKVDFRPRSIGRKTAQLVVEENGVTATATLMGEGIFACRAYLVTCNYAYYYSGQYTVRTVDSTVLGTLGRKGRWSQTVDVRIDKGVVTCSGVQQDWEEEYSGSTLNKRSTAQGPIDGPGLFAIEFSGIGPSMEYRMTFDCPSAALKTTDIDYVSRTSSTGAVPAEPAEWRHASLAADPQRATKLGMDLVGKQTDLRSEPAANNDVAGYTAMVWSIKR
jgi:hypothetical protein